MFQKFINRFAHTVFRSRFSKDNQVEVHHPDGSVERAVIQERVFRRLPGSKKYGWVYTIDILSMEQGEGNPILRTKTRFQNVREELLTPHPNFYCRECDCGK
ncbi:MAG: hypothetical protein ABI747_04440 [Candidatus Moraniibacteriota bacterium]